MAPFCPTAPVAEPAGLVAARAYLAAVLCHPAFSAERRQRAAALARATADAAQLRQWAALALRESERWEDAEFAREEAQPGPPAYPPYPY